MNKNLNWLKDTFDSKYQVFDKGILTFALNFSSFKNSAIATTQDGIFLFKSLGVSKPESHILNNKNEVLAVITFQWLELKANIEFRGGEKYLFRFQKTWLTEWTINNGTDKQIFYKSKSGSGLVNSNVDDEILILIGLYVKEYFSRLIILFFVFVVVSLLVQGAF